MITNDAIPAPMVPHTTDIRGAERENFQAEAMDQLCHSFPMLTSAQPRGGAQRPSNETTRGVEVDILTLPCHLRKAEGGKIDKF